MDNKQPRNPNDLLIIQNIDNEDFRWQYDAIRTPLPYIIHAGEVRELPFYIASHGVDKLIDKMLQKQNKIHTSSLFRAELYDKIVLGLKHINFIQEKTANELELEKLQRSKEANPIEEVLKRREIEAEQRQRELAASQLPKAPLIQTIGQPITPVAVESTNPIAPVTPPVAPNQPSFEADRQNVYNLLTTKLHLDLTHEATKQKFDSMSVEQLKNEFASELPELANPAAAVVPDTKESLSGVGMPLTPTQPMQPRPAQPATPQILVNPSTPALLDQQLEQIN